LVCFNFNISNIILKNTLSIGGLTAILISSRLISDKDIYPGYLALIPTFGAASIILAGQDAIINKHIL